MMRAEQVTVPVPCVTCLMLAHTCDRCRCLAGPWSERRKPSGLCVGEAAMALQLDRAYLVEIEDGRLSPLPKLAAKMAALYAGDDPPGGGEG